MPHRSIAVTRRQPLVATTITTVRRKVRILRAREQTIGLVPTMGYFHEGHSSLMRAAREECDYVVVSIFVNPLQFGPQEDLDEYPRDAERDLELAACESVDMIFSPETGEMFSGTAAGSRAGGFADTGSRTYIEPGPAAAGLCGAARPGHFRGVTTIVAKLFNIVRPERAYFGGKDAQQAAVIRQMVRDLDFGIDIRVLPTVREPDGLAMSSRNVYLTADERKHAQVLYRALSAARAAAAEGETGAAALRLLLEKSINAEPGVEFEYAEIVDADSMRPVEEIDGDSLAMVAVTVGGARLIDNMFLLGGKD